jgi:branched-chain amino acid transport system substrate-binding protein
MLRTSTRKLLATAAVAALGFGGSAFAQDVKLGALNGMTGGLAAYAPPIIDGEQLAVDHVNAQGGVLGGRKLQLILGDTQSNPAGAVDAAQKLVNVDGVAGIVGALASSATIATAESVAVPAGIPMISPASTSPLITGLSDNGFVFRATVSDAYQGVVLAKITKDRGINKVAVSYINNDYGKGLADAFANGFKKLGGTVTGFQAHEENKASYRAELKTLTNGGPEGLVLIAYPDSGGKILMRQALENDFFDRFIMTDGMRQAEVVRDIGAENLQKSFGSAAEPPGDSTAAQKFTAAYSKAYETTKDKFYIAEAYDAAFMLALAIEKAGSTDGAKIKAALNSICCAPGEKVEPGEWAKAKQLIAQGKDIDYVGGGGKQDFDANGDVEGSIGEWIVEPNGDYKVIRLFQ